MKRKFFETKVGKVVRGLWKSFLYPDKLVTGAIFGARENVLNDKNAGSKINYTRVIIAIILILSLIGVLTGKINMLYFLELLNRYA